MIFKQMNMLRNERPSQQGYEQIPSDKADDSNRPAHAQEVPTDLNKLIKEGQKLA